MTFDNPDLDLTTVLPYPGVPLPDLDLVIARRRTLDEVLRDTAQLHGVDVAEMRGPSRVAHLVRARTTAYRILRAEPLRWSLPAIGRAFDRDHTTIMAALSGRKDRR